MKALVRLITLGLRHVEPALAAMGERLLALRWQRIPLGAETGQQPLLLG